MAEAAHNLASVAGLHVPTKEMSAPGMLEAAIDTVNLQCRSGARMNTVVGYDNAGHMVIGTTFPSDGSELLSEKIGNAWEKANPKFWFLLVYDEFVLGMNPIVLRPWNTVVITTGVYDKDGGLHLHAALGTVKPEGFFPTPALFAGLGAGNIPEFGFAWGMKT